MDAPYTVIIPARLASTRLPNKPLADIAGLPMVVRVAQRVQQGLPQQVRTVVAADHRSIVDACTAHGVECILTRADHPSGSDRLAEASSTLGLDDAAVVVNVQGDEPLIDPALADAVARLLTKHPEASMGTAAHPIHDVSDWHNPNVVKVVTSSTGMALYFSRAPIPAWRDAPQHTGAAAVLPTPAPLRHIGIYAYRAAFLRRFPTLAPAPLEQLEALEQLRALWHGHSIAVHLSAHAAGAGVDTPEDLERVRTIFGGAAAAGRL